MKQTKFEELDTARKALVVKAHEAKEHSYAPYSKFLVGCSLLMVNGSILIGANQENAAYPLCLCAERVALAYAAMHQPGAIVRSMAISTSAELGEGQVPAAPCGACRQVILEYQSRQIESIEIILVGKNNVCWIFENIHALLPHSFDQNFLT